MCYIGCCFFCCENDNDPCGLCCPWGRKIEQKQNIKISILTCFCCRPVEEKYDSDADQAKTWCCWIFYGYSHWD